jgi:hypothetical protein
MGEFSGIWLLVKSGRRFQKKCVKNCSCCRYQHSLVWRILHEQSLYPCHIHWIQALTDPDHRGSAVFCQWLLASCFVNTQFVANFLFADEVGFSSDCTAHNTYVWVVDNPHTTVESRYQHQFSINVRMGTLGDQLLASVVFLNRLTGAVYHCSFFLLVNGIPLLLKHVPLHQQQHMWFMC